MNPQTYFIFTHSYSQLILTLLISQMHAKLIWCSYFNRLFERVLWYTINFEYFFYIIYWCNWSKQLFYILKMIQSITLKRCIKNIQKLLHAKIKKPLKIWGVLGHQHLRDSLFLMNECSLTLNNIVKTLESRICMLVVASNALECPFMISFNIIFIYLHNFFHRS